MEESTGAAARLITAELRRALDHLPGGAPVAVWARVVREWPGRVVPGTDAQVRAAVLTLLSRALWPPDQCEALVAALAPRYRAGWCNDAIVRALDHDPDGTRVPPWHTTDGRGGPRGELLPYVQGRLARWRDADPPLPATSFPDWAARMRTVHGGAHRAGTPPRRLDPDQAHRVYDRNHRARPHPAPEPVPRAPDRDVAPPPDPHLALLADPRVRAAVTALARATAPRRHHLHQLRAAVRHADLDPTAPTPDPEQLRQWTARVTRGDGTPVDPQALSRLIGRFR